MDYFRIYVYDKTKQLLRTTDLIAENKTAALTNARDFLTNEAHWFAFELWQNARRVHKEIRNTVEMPPTPMIRTVARLEVSPPPAATTDKPIRLKVIQTSRGAPASRSEE